mmetsp:Transcript_57493/g.65216  ORF Transcript_57493/g.65216 Transcript_57493/m.65216 type:complete len:101 (-) Transcript_57493:80-382(-)
MHRKQTESNACATNPFLGVVIPYKCSIVVHHITTAERETKNMFVWFVILRKDSDLIEFEFDSYHHPSTNFVPIIPVCRNFETQKEPKHYIHSFSLLNSGW